jgi:OmpA-OmpF porin, OOP family
MKKISSLIAATFVSGICGASLAEAAPYYLTVNAGISRLKDFCASPAVGFSCKDTATAYGLDGGYQYSDRFGFELGYADYGAPKTSGPVSGSNLEVSQQISAFRISATASLPLSNSFALTGKLGISNTTVNVTSTVTPGPAIPGYTASSTSLAYGAGISYNLSKTVALRAQYENLGKTGDDTTGTDTLSLLSIGITYYFEQAKPYSIRHKRAAKPPVATPPVPIRVIVTLAQPPAEDREQLTAAIAQACQCQPAFVRLYDSNAVIFQIDLAPGQTYASFESALLSADVSPGIKSVAQDKLMQAQ